MPIESRAVVMNEAGKPLTIETIQVDDPGPGEVRVKMVAAGVCHSDLSMTTGTVVVKTPIALGHEGSAVVESVGEGVTDVKVGDHVILNWAPPCRDCTFCNGGEPWLCLAGASVGGTTFAKRDSGEEIYAALGTATFSEYSTLPASSVVKIDDDSNMEHAAVIGCAMMTGVGAVKNTAKVQAGDSVAIIGMGGVGLSALQGAKMLGADPIIAIDASEAKRDLAMEMGATHFVVNGEGTQKEVRGLAGGGVDHAFEVVGKPATIRLAYGVARRGGHVTIVGVGKKSEEIVFNAMELFWQARTLQGSVFGSCDPAVDGPDLLRRAADGQIDPGALITDKISLDDVPAAFERMQQGVGGRSLIVF